MAESYHSAICFRVVVKFIPFFRECITTTWQGWKRVRRSVKLMAEAYPSAICFRVVVKFIPFFRECIATTWKGQTCQGIIMLSKSYLGYQCSNCLSTRHEVVGQFGTIELSNPGTSPGLDWRCFGNFPIKLVDGVAVGQFWWILFFRCSIDDWFIITRRCNRRVIM